MTTTRCPACGEAIDATPSRCPACGNELAPQRRLHRFSVGDVIDGKFEVVDLLPAGGMGELYKVRHVHLNDFRVVKVLRADRTSDEARLRFAREAKIAAGIQHPNLGAIYDFSSLSDGSFYMVEEFIDGVTIAQHLREGYRFTLGQTLRVGEEVLAGLASLHERGIVHRDISPENLIITRSSTGATIVKIIDLGIAKPIEGEALTTAGVFVGKPHYASPEQLRIVETGQRLDARTDLYSLGVVLYEMLVGHTPYDAATPLEYAVKQTKEEVRSLNPPGQEAIVPAEIDAFIVKLLRSNREERFSSAEEALAALRLIRVRFPSFRDSTLSRFFPSALRGDRAATEPVESLWEEPQREMEPTVVDENSEFPGQQNEAEDSKTEVVPLAQLKSGMNVSAPPPPPEEGATQVVPLAQLRSAIDDARAQNAPQPATVVEPIPYAPPSQASAPTVVEAVSQPATATVIEPVPPQAPTVVERVPQFELDEPGAAQAASEMRTVVEPSGTMPPPPPPPDSMRTVVEATPPPPESLRTIVEVSPSQPESLRTIVEQPQPAATPSPFMNPAAEGLVLPMAAAPAAEIPMVSGGAATIPIPKFSQADFVPQPVAPSPMPPPMPATPSAQPQIPIMRDLAAEGMAGRTVAEGVYPPFPVQTPAPAPMPQSAYAPMPQAKKSGGAGVKIFVVLLLLVIFLGLIGGGVLAYRMYGSKLTAMLQKSKPAVATESQKPVVQPPPVVPVQTQTVAALDTAATATNLTTTQPPVTDTTQTSAIYQTSTTAPITRTTAPQTTKSKKPARRPQPKKRPEQVVTQQRVIEAPPPPPPPAVHEGDLVTKGPGVTDAHVSVFPPEYPEQAKRGRAEGLVRVSVLVNQFGKVEDVRVAQSSGNRYLDDAALKAARKSNYTPAMKDGVRVKIWKNLEFVFKMP